MGNSLGCGSVSSAKKASKDYNWGGPDAAKRSCTDLPCLILLILYLIVDVGIAWFALNEGNPLTLILPTDSRGNLCGNGEYENKPNLLYFNLMDCIPKNPLDPFGGCSTPQVCVENCPTSNWYFEMAKIKCLGDDDCIKTEVLPEMICQGDFVVNMTNYEQAIDENICASYKLTSNSVASRCVPGVGNLTDELSGFDLDLNVTAIEENSVGQLSMTKGIAYIKNALNDFKASQNALIVAIICVTFFAFFWIIIMRYLATPIVWSFVFLLLAVEGAGAYFTFSQWNELKTNDGTIDNQFIEATSGNNWFNALLEKPMFWQALFYVVAVIGGITLLCVLGMCKHISTACGLIAESSSSLGDIWSALFFPFPVAIMTVISLFYTIVVLGFLQTSDKPLFHQADEDGAVIMTKCDPELFSGAMIKMYEDKCAAVALDDGLDDGGCETSCPITCDPKKIINGVSCIMTGYGGDTWFHNNISLLSAMHVFHGLWSLAFIGALSEFTLAGAFSSRYFTRADKNGKRKMRRCTLPRSFWRGIAYHSGTLAFGAAIIAIIQMIRISIEFVDRKLKKLGKDNPAVKITMCICKCFLYCLEKFLQYVNRNAYIVCAIFGKSFCPSAKEGVGLIFKNPMVALTVTWVTNALLLIGKLVVSGISGLAAYMYFVRQKQTGVEVVVEVATNVTSRLAEASEATSTEHINYPYLLVIYIVIAAYIISSQFFNIFQMAVDTIFICFLEDQDINDGSEDHPYYASANLLKKLKKKN